MIQREAIHPIRPIPAPRGAIRFILSSSHFPVPLQRIHFHTFWKMLLLFHISYTYVVCFSSLYQPVPALFISLSRFSSVAFYTSSRQTSCNWQPFTNLSQPVPPTLVLFSLFCLHPFTDLTLLSLSTPPSLQLKVCLISNCSRSGWKTQSISRSTNNI